MSVQIEVGMKVMVPKFTRRGNGTIRIGKRYGEVKGIYPNFILVRMKEGHNECFRINELRKVQD